jgi:NarL family two-component system response regulator LiaR
VLIVDDHAAVRRGLMTSLKAFEDIVPVAEAANGIESLSLCSWYQPDVVLMDLMMDELDGVKTTRVIRELYANTQVIVLANFNDSDAMIQAALQAGAIGCLRKDIPADKLADMIRTAHLGKAIPWGTA